MRRMRRGYQEYAYDGLFDEPQRIRAIARGRRVSELILVMAHTFYIGDLRNRTV